MIHLGSSFLVRELLKQFSRNFSLSRSAYDTHYEVLQLPRNCTQKDIKNAFIKLSKEYHPDRSADASTHNKFVRLNEAYTTLSRPDARKEYDLSLVPDSYAAGGTSRRFFYDNDFADDRPNPRAFRDSSFWVNRDISRDRAMNRNKPYYGIKGVKRMTNSWILTLLILFAIFGVGLQVILIRKSVAFSRKALDEESRRNCDIYREVRARALAGEAGGDEETAVQRLVRASTPPSPPTPRSAPAANDDHH